MFIRVRRYTNIMASSSESEIQSEQLKSGEGDDSARYKLKRVSMAILLVFLLIGFLYWAAAYFFDVMLFELGTAPSWVVILLSVTSL